MKGDDNTSFFHISALKHRKRNQIKKIKDDLGVEATTLAQIGLLGTGYFQHALSKPVEAPNLVVDDLLLDFVPTLLTTLDNVDILHFVTPKEDRLVDFSMGAFKVPVLDGFSSTFFQEHWNIMGEDLYLVTIDFFKSSKLLK